jgi:hypothetical protein
MVTKKTDITNSKDGVKYLAFSLFMRRKRISIRQTLLDVPGLVDSDTGGFATRRAAAVALFVTNGDLKHCYTYPAGKLPRGQVDIAHASVQLVHRKDVDID